MIKISTLSNVSSTAKLNAKGLKRIEPAQLSVDLLIGYSKALQVIRCREFRTAYIVLN